MAGWRISPRSVTSTSASVLPTAAATAAAASISRKEQQHPSSSSKQWRNSSNINPLLTPVRLILQLLPCCAHYCVAGGSGSNNIINGTQQAKSSSPRIRIASLTFRLFIFLLACTYGIQRTISNVRGRKEWMHAPIISIERKCPPPGYPTILLPVVPNNNNVTTSSIETTQSSSAPKICLTTLTDEQFKPWFQKVIALRNYDGLLQLTWPNKQWYCDKHGYKLFDESHLMQRNKARPPAWTKILAAQRLLLEEDCDWVVWLDADTVIMNSEIRIESFLPLPLATTSTTTSKNNNNSTTRTSYTSGPDFVIVEDNGGGYNSGVWAIRNSPWSLQFLQEWYDMKDYVRPPGASKSGDNYSLKHKLRDMKKLNNSNNNNNNNDNNNIDNEFSAHVVVPPRCTCNSFAKFVKPRDHLHHVKNQERQDYFKSEAYYHKGDFIAHVAGIDNKYGTLEMLLEEAK